MEDHGSCVCNLGNCKKSLKKYRLGWDIHVNPMIAVQHSYQLSYQASLELLVFVWIQTYSQERQTKIMCMYSFSYWEFMLQI